MCLGVVLSIKRRKQKFEAIRITWLPERSKNLLVIFLPDISHIETTAKTITAAKECTKKVGLAKATSIPKKAIVPRINGKSLFIIPAN